MILRIMSHRSFLTRMIRILVSILFVALIGCSKRQDSSASPKVSEEIQIKTPEVGSLDSNGRLVFWTIDAFDHIEPFILNDEHGVVLLNAGTQENPEARYILASQATRTVLVTSDFARFEQALRSIPAGTEIGVYDTCSVSRSYGLPEETVKQFRLALDEAKLRVLWENRSVCYCPHKG